MSPAAAASGTASSRYGAQLRLPQYTGRSMPRRGELRLQCRLQRAVLRVDGAHPAEVAVVVRDLFEALVRDAAPARDVAQEGDDVVLALGTAEAGEQDPVVGDGPST